jgi:hypothetical protein
MTDTKIIYIQDDRRDCTTIQFCYSEDMQPIDNWIEAVYGEDKEDVFHDHWQQLTPITFTGIRNLETTKLSVDDFICMCNTLDYVVKRVKNELTNGGGFKISCLEAYPWDFK